jgi:hypothetical protein
MPVKDKDVAFAESPEVQVGGTTDTALAAAAFGDRLYIVTKVMG